MSEQGAESSASKIKPGTIIDGRYEVVGVLGRGGFATVYRAKQVQLGHEVAVKVLQVSDDFRERFFREAQTAASIKHPDVVSTIDYGYTEDDSPYMVMELLQGRPLDVELRKKGGMKVSRAKRLFVRCLDALQAAHDMSIIHRDLKPANLFITGVGTRVETLRILDFGIALMLTEDTRLTTTGQLFGTPRYLAPEYIQKNLVTPTLDVYQMGLIFVECLTGRNIIEAENNYTFIFAHCNGEISVPRQIMDSPLGPVIAQALSTNHETRFATAGDFRDALDDVDISSIKDKTYALPKAKDGIEPETMLIMRDYIFPSGVLSGDLSRTKAKVAEDAEDAEPEAAPDPEETGDIGNEATEAVEAPSEAADISSDDTQAVPAPNHTLALGEEDVEFVKEDNVETRQVDPKPKKKAQPAQKSEEKAVQKAHNALSDANTAVFTADGKPVSAAPAKEAPEPLVTPSPEGSGPVGHADPTMALDAASLRAGGEAAGGGSNKGLIIGVVVAVVLLGVVGAVAASMLGGDASGTGGDNNNGALASNNANNANANNGAAPDGDGTVGDPGEADTKPDGETNNDGGGVAAGATNAVEPPVTNNAPPPVEEKAVEVKIVVEPPEAQILLGDKDIAEGGVGTLSFPGASAAALEVCGDLKGYKRSCKNIAPIHAPEYTIKLVKRAATPTRARRRRGNTNPGLELPE